MNRKVNGLHDSTMFQIVHKYWQFLALFEILQHIKINIIIHCGKRSDTNVPAILNVLINLLCRLKESLLDVLTSDNHMSGMKSMPTQREITATE